MESKLLLFQKASKNFSFSLIAKRKTESLEKIIVQDKTEAKRSKTKTSLTTIPVPVTISIIDMALS
jgi:hypothetical protein